VTEKRLKVDCWKRLPTALHCSNRVSKKVQLLKVQLVKAALVCREALNRTPEKVHSSKMPPSLTTSVQSVS
jgi:hypothetical protein